MEQSEPLLHDYELSEQKTSWAVETHGADWKLSTGDGHVEKRSPELPVPASGRHRIIWTLLLRYLRLLPAYALAILPRYMRRGGLRPTKKQHVTSYLDALRGLAALIVVNHHSWAYTNTWLIQLPFFRVLFSGRGMVDIFFVISGYVLSHKLLRLMRNQDTAALLDALSSACYRRYLRLYCSAGVVTFTGMLLIWLRWVDMPYMTVKDTFLGQFWDWILDCADFSNPFVFMQGWWTRDVHSSRYNGPLWTIPVEFSGSMVVFAFCVATCKLPTKNRMRFCWGLILLCYWWSTIYVSLFLMGLFLADLSFSRDPDRLHPSNQLLTSSNKSTTRSTSPSLKLKIICSIMFVGSLFLLGQPEDLGRQGPFPWQYLSRLVPSRYNGSEIAEHFWLSIGAFMLMWALDTYPTLQVPLTWNFPQYLGDLSFGIYVMHFFIIYGLATQKLGHLREEYLGDSLWAYAPTTIINYLAVLWAADLFTRVDRRVVNFGRWLQSKTFTW